MTRRFFEHFATNDWSLLALRLAVGFGFVAHGYAKLERGPEHFAAILAALRAPAPLALAWLTVGVELSGGICLMLGAAVRRVSLPLIVVMLVAMAKVHLRYGFSSIRLTAVVESGAQFGPIGYELNLLYICSLLVLAFGPTTPLSIDRCRFRARSRSSRPGG